MLILLEAQEGNWDEIDAMVRAFQNATMALKYSPVPVVAAPAGLALGGGCEIACTRTACGRRRRPTSGLVEVGVGLLPAGGGTKEMLLRAVDRSRRRRSAARPCRRRSRRLDSARSPRARRTRGDWAISRREDAVTMNRERVMADAKVTRLARAGAGYQPPVPRERVPVGGADMFATLSLGIHLAGARGRITEHDG